MSESQKLENSNYSHKQNETTNENTGSNSQTQDLENKESQAPIPLEINPPESHSTLSENNKFELENQLNQQASAIQEELNHKQINETSINKEDSKANNSQNFEKKEELQNIELNQKDTLQNNPEEQEFIAEENINETIKQEETNLQTPNSIEVRQKKPIETKEQKRIRVKEKIKYKGIAKDKIEFIKKTEQYLSENFRFFSFFEMMNLLYYLCTLQNKDPQEAIIIEPPLKSKNILTGIVDFKIDYVYRIYTNEIAMWGVNSPAPEYFTNQIITSSELGYDGLKDFLTLFQNQLAHLHYKILLTQNPIMKLVQDKSTDIQDYLLKLIKVDKNNVDSTINPYSILEFIDLFLFNKRNYVNLKLLCNRLAKKSNVKVALDQFHSREYKIDSADYTRLNKRNSQLGYDTVLGNRIKSNSKSILFAFAFDSYKELEDFMNTDTKYSFYYFRNVVTLYLGFNFLFEFEFIVDKIQVNTLGEFFKLGFNSWIIQDAQLDKNIHKDSIKKLF